MTLAQLVAEYGYLAVFVGSLLEGETILLLAGFAAHQGYLSLPLTIAVAFVGGTLGDQFFFWLGRTRGKQLLQRFPKAQPRVQLMKRLLQRYHAPIIVLVRFMYGMRILGPIVIGACSIAAWRFAIFNIIGAAIWAPLVTVLGYLFGDAVQLMLDHMAEAHVAALALFVLVVAAGLGIRHWRRRKRRE
ncbi:MAG: DedA family protein [Burkholderiales bacterium]|nr:DedA family protein [Burkholderiales bacterium]MDE2396574.1 DedA family protein [Burkholderiales bacterium]MDE2452671.1 DedA family protein [Burkholderiales bacterium]